MRHNLRRLSARIGTTSPPQRRTTRWCAAGVTLALGLAYVASLSWRRADEEYRVNGIVARRLQYWDDLLISKPCCKIPPGEKVPRATYNLASTGEKFFVILHIVCIGYMLLGLNTVCDAYFTGALDVMVNKWQIKPDVAGATFMAAGGSAPELFTSLIGAVVTANDVGISTIVGSAVFNVLFVIGLCGVFAIKPIALTWWPLFRDCSFYILGLLVLALFARSPFPTGCIEWWEALVLFLLYVLYCSIMFFNERLEALITRACLRRRISSKVAPATEDEPTQAEQLRVAATQSEEESFTKDPVEELVTVTEDPVTPVKEDRVVDLVETDISSPAASSNGDAVERVELRDKGESYNVRDAKIEVPEPIKATAPDVQDNQDENEEEEDEEDPIEEMMVKPDGAFDQVIWYLSLPIYVQLYYLIPKPTERWFLATFGVSLFWIAFYSFFLVYCVEVLGEVIGIPVVVMGLTLLAAGTSIPDLVSSVAVARAGEGDMAVSSSIGSNIFDILVGLPVPWMLKIMVVDPLRGYGMMPVPVGGFIVFYVFVLLFMVLMVIISIHCLGWRLNKLLGVAMGLLYILFLGVALTVEFLNNNIDMTFLMF
eukprot:TRINITY_DN16854_c0_g1_i1.p1 TRINITY_DN16854_c0_g1~~TRINITY_DN16854_c0_g1_i1.p1  ORF type:complete len:598 (+),score=112.75 TRINITY_DN16854_c0_g1_i1:75-1868(+)